MGVLMDERPDTALPSSVRQRGLRWAWSTGLTALLATAAIGAWLAVSDPDRPLAPAGAPQLPTGATVRVQVDRVGDHWLGGRAISAPLGCTLVRLDDERRAGAASVRLRELRALHRSDADGVWTALPVGILLAGEPPGCPTG